MQLPDIDFLNKKFLYRLTHVSKNKELLAKAVGIKGDYKPYVVDATAGLGRDAFLLAYLGCRVVALERVKIIAEQLQQALQLALDDPRFAASQINLQFIHADAKDYLTQISDRELPDVIYLDPMYPERTKSALVKTFLKRG